MGKRYFGRQKLQEKWSYDIERETRKMKERCVCKSTKYGTLKCDKVSEEERKKIFDYCWKLTWGEKKVFIDNTVKAVPISRPRDRKNNESSKRTQTLQYFLRINDQDVRVCRKMYLNTTSLGRWSVQHWKNKFSLNIPEGSSNKSAPSCYRIEKGNQKKPFQIQNDGLKESLNALPTMESHYCRATSSKNYLLPEWHSKSELYQFYVKDWCASRNISALSISTFNNEFHSKNMALFRPKKDQCEICERFKNNQLSEDKFNLHIARKNEARKEKQEDTENEKFVYTVDLQAVLMSPKSNVSSLYYKTKLCVHNQCFFNLKNKDGFCYLWNECEGGLTAEEFASCFHNFIEMQVLPLINKSEENPKIIIYSDGCTYQNRNSTMSNVAINLAKSHKITIEHKYLEVGHTQMQVDSMHSTIARQVKNKRINVPAEYAYHSRLARKNPKPYNVKYLEHSFFKSFGKIETLKSIRPGKKKGDPKVSDIRAMKYTPQGEVFYKVLFSDPWELLPQRQQLVVVKLWDELDNLHERRIPISVKKYTDLQELKSTLAVDYHEFYDNLPHE